MSQFTSVAVDFSIDGIFVNIRNFRKFLTTKCISQTYIYAGSGLSLTTVACIAKDRGSHPKTTFYIQSQLLIQVEAQAQTCSSTETSLDIIVCSQLISIAYHTACKFCAFRRKVHCRTRKQIEIDYTIGVVTTKQSCQVQHSIQVDFTKLFTIFVILTICAFIEVGIVLIVKTLPQTAHFTTYPPSRSNVFTNLEIEVHGRSIQAAIQNRHASNTNTHKDVV